MNIRELTKESHKSAESHALNQDFISGNISDEAYNLYVSQRSLIIRFLDYFLPEEFNRGDEFFKDLPEGFNFPVLKSTLKYLEHLENLNEDFMIAHIYVNYMGDLHGGQIIRVNNPDRENHHLNFDGISNEFIGYIRNEMKDKDEVLFEEANNAFSFIENILDDVAGEVS